VACIALCGAALLEHRSVTAGWRQEQHAAMEVARQEALIVSQALAQAELAAEQAHNKTRRTRRRRR